MSQQKEKEVDPDFCTDFDDLLIWSEEEGVSGSRAAPPQLLRYLHTLPAGDESLWETFGRKAD